MTVAIQKVRIVPAVIVALELQELGAPGVGPRQTQGKHGGFAPVLVKRTTSADGTIRRKRSAASVSAGVAAAKCDPVAIASETTSASLGCACPWMRAPNDIMKSTYSLSSTSHTWEPRPRSITIGEGE